MRPSISVRGFVRPSVGPSLGPLVSTSHIWWEFKENMQNFKSWHHFIWLMQYCIILNKLSSMWTYCCTLGEQQYVQSLYGTSGLLGLQNIFAHVLVPFSFNKAHHLCGCITHTDASLVEHSWWPRPLGSKNWVKWVHFDAHMQLRFVVFVVTSNTIVHCSIIFRFTNLWYDLPQPNFQSHGMSTPNTS